jgi:phenylalanyl-tRNA synthetase alpha subunit
VGSATRRTSRRQSTFAAADSICTHAEPRSAKKLKIHTESEADRLYAELKLNFDKERLQDGNVILVIDDISKEIKQYLINMKVQSLSKEEVLKMAANFDELEDRQKVLRIVYEEFRREYSSRIK